MDNPDTETTVTTAPETEEAQAAKNDGKASKKKAAASVIFRTRDEEPLNIELLGVRPVRNPEYPGHYEWVLTAAQAEKAENHYHVRSGRIVKIG